MMENVIISELNLTFWRKLGVMGNTSQDSTEDTNSVPENKIKWHVKKIVKKVLKFLEHPYTAAVAASITTSLIMGFFNQATSAKQLTEQVKEIQSNINSTIETAVANQLTTIEGNITTNTETQISDFKTEIDQDFQELRNEINTITDINNYNYLYFDMNEQFADMIKETYRSDQAIYNASKDPTPLNLKQVVATNKITGKEYTVPDLENKTIVMQYDENGEEVFFKGQFDENGYWDKGCVINRYKDGKLVMVMDAMYEAGELKSYQQMFPYTTLSGNDVWVDSIRTIENVQEDVRSGETFMYFRSGEYIKEFGNANVLDTDIMNVEAFKEKIDLKPEGYYNGYTSNGRFNDESKSAYLVKYNLNGEVRFLYVGAIKDGLPDDDSGNAWSVSWGYADDGYYYYKGVFSGGNHGETPPDWRAMTQEEINTIVNPQNFACPLTGLFPNV